MMARFVSVSSCQFHFGFREVSPPSVTSYPRRFEVNSCHVFSSVTVVCDRSFEVRCSELGL